MTSIKIFCMFVVRNTLRNEALTNKQTETNVQGWHTGESPAVFPEPRFGVSRSDHPFLFHLNSFKVMRDTEMDTCARCAKEKPVTAQGIVNAILESDEPENILENLRELMDTFFLHYEAPSDRFKHSVYWSFSILSDALKQMVKLNQSRRLS